MLTLGLATWWGTVRIVDDRRAEIGEALATVLETTHQAIRSWATEHRAAAEVWAEALAQGTRGVEEPIGMAPIGSTGPTGTPHSSTRHFKAFSRTLWSAPISTTGIRVRSERCAGQEM